MSQETLNSQTIRTPSREESIEYLRANLAIEPRGEVLEEGYVDIAYSLQKEKDGGYSGWLSQHRTDGFIKVEPEADTEDRQIFDYAADKIKNGSIVETVATSGLDGQWWFGSLAETAVTTKLKEVFRVNDGEKTLDILNCTDEPLPEHEHQAIERTMSAVINFTGGKLLDRVKGVVLVHSDELGKPNASADFDPISGVARINIDEIRSDEGKVFYRYEPYFRGREDITALEPILAHELGHAMDVRYIEEVEAHGINKDKTQWSAYGGNTHGYFSAFQENFGWESTVVTDEKGLKQNKWNVDVAQEVECREFTPTGYSRISPQEDFAETFAIMALGGNMASMPQRYKKIAETIQLAESPGSIGPKKVTMEKFDCSNGTYEPHKLKGLAVSVYVAE